MGDQDNHRIHRCSLASEYLEEAANIRSPSGLAVGRDHRFFIDESGYLDPSKVARFGIKARVTICTALGIIQSAWGNKGDPLAPGPFATSPCIVLGVRDDIYAGGVTHAAREVFDRLPPGDRALQRSRWIN